jgi:hypothetical protein
MPDLLEVLLAKARETRAEDLGVPSDPVVNSGKKCFLGVRVVPVLGVLVALLDKDRRR